MASSCRWLACYVIGALCHKQQRSSPILLPRSELKAQLHPEDSMIDCRHATGHVHPACGMVTYTKAQDWPLTITGPQVCRRSAANKKSLDHDHQLNCSHMHTCCTLKMHAMDKGIKRSLSGFLRRVTTADKSVASAAGNR